MLSLSTEYAAQSSAKNIVSDWLLELSYEDSVDGDGTFYFSGKTRTVTNTYLGNVLDWGAIDESIDIINSQSSTSDIQIVLANSYANDSGLLSAELFGGNQKFINQDVLIKSWIPDLSLTNSLTLFKGRLTDIKHNLDTVTLTIEKRSPWDRLKITPVKSTVKSINFPEAYGDFSKNTEDLDTSTDKAVYPCPVNDVSGESIVPLLADVVYTHPADVPFMHYYDKNLDLFAYVPNVASWYSNAVSYQGGQAAYVDASFARSITFRPTNVTARTQGFTYPEKSIDTDDTTYAIKTFSTTSTTGNFFYLYIEPPKIGSEVTEVKLWVKYRLKAGEGLSTGDTQVALYDVSYGLSDPERNLFASNTTNNSTHDGETNVDWFNADNYSASNQMPENIILQGVLDSATGYLDQGQVWIYDVYFEITAQVDLTSEQSSTNDLNSVDELYCGNNGYLSEWTGGSSVLAEYPHDIYRDMLDRYASWDAGNLNWVFSNGALWAASSIDTDRNWACRWWTTEQLKLREVLNQLQFEGGFMWLFDNTVSTRKARVIYVKSSYSSADVVSPYGATLDYGDIANIDISITPLSEIVTKRTLNFQRHPADERRYIQSNSKTNTNRADYNLDTDENAIEQNLDFLTATGDVDDLLDYYDNIVGEPKLIVKCDLLNPVNWALQVGDIVNFANMAYDPYGKDWTTPIYFMCTRTNVSPNKFTATFREVG